MIYQYKDTESYYIIFYKTKYNVVNFVQYIYVYVGAVLSRNR
jgi:hypothetical protein